MFSGKPTPLKWLIIIAIIGFGVGLIFDGIVGTTGRAVGEIFLFITLGFWVARAFQSNKNTEKD